MQLPGSCWLFSMPDALRDGVSWGGKGREVYGGGRGHVEGRGRSQLKAVVENQAKWRATC